VSVFYHERPGVYSDFDASSVTARGAGAKIVGIIGVSTATSGLYTVTAYGDGATAFGEDSQLAKLLRLAFLNGAGTVLAYPVAIDDVASYSVALESLLAEKRAKILVLGSALETVQILARDKVEAASRQKGECICLVGMENPTAEELVTRGEILNHPRMVLVGADVYERSGQNPVGGFMGAAALAGVLAVQTDPALPLNYQRLLGLDGVTIQPTDAQVDLLVCGGVTVLEISDGQVRIIRGITTCSKKAGIADMTYRELNTILIIDHVIPAVRQSLQAKFSSAKNNEATRSAINSQVVVELEHAVAREIINGYEGLSVRASEEDPTVCLVEFGMSVTHGLNRIYLTAHIRV